MKNLLKKFKAVLVLLCISLCTALLFSGKAYADTLIDYEKIYNQGVQENYINPETIPLEDWLKENEEYKRVYDEGINEGVLQSDIKYDEWIKANCYGQPPIANSEMFEEFEINTKSRSVLGFNFQSGDILITNGTSSAGFLGHAAIATGSSSILDIPGIGKTTRQKRPQNWIDEYTKNGGWIKVYRISNTLLAKQAAYWADTHYYSPNGNSIQHIRPSYAITTNLYSTDPTYCSKIVYQAYWFGTGQVSVMKAMSGIVSPYGLIDCFNRGYTPILQVTYA